ncbi:MAG TPA: cytochrome c maturation protein CcmE [Aestuariivirgaceae bacterium]|jgi:cytochrome c-type biogenesis protein CcmE|nr:cytochrome c maturation protein CcmE [Aestuariivirgaceae bacterium]
MTRKQQRALLLIGGLALLGIAAGLVLYALNDSIVFFYTPSEALARHVAEGQRFRLGGLVEKGSVRHDSNDAVTFTVTDRDRAMAVSYQGQLPDLFREGQGVVAEGRLGPGGVFQADSVLAKHDETYMPKEVADALKAKGVWKEGSTP